MRSWCNYTVLLLRLSLGGRIDVSDMGGVQWPRYFLKPLLKNHQIMRTF